MQHEMAIEPESPILFEISFNKLIEQYEELAKCDVPLLSDRASRILQIQAPFPELRKGFKDISLLDQHKDIIHQLLQDSFPEVLTHNEIKAAALPYKNVVFNTSKRFQKIVRDAGPDFKLAILDFSDEVYYITACTIILSQTYNVTINLKKPLVCRIPDKRGVDHYFRIVYNTDFVELLPTEKSKALTSGDIDQLLDNNDNLELWKAKIPPRSFICKGLVIMSMFEITHEYAISEIKSNLIGENRTQDLRVLENMNGIFRSLFDLPNIRFGLSIYNPEDVQFQKDKQVNIHSFILGDNVEEACADALCMMSYKTLLRDNEVLIIADVEKYYKSDPENPLYLKLKAQGVKSAIFAPIVDDKLVGVLEFVSDTPNDLHGVNAKILDDVMPYIALAVSHAQKEEENLIDAIIQQECTTVHSSVYWKFREVAKHFRSVDLEGGIPFFEEIVFKDVFPLYGQVDIKDSSLARNKAIQKDLIIQLSEIKDVLQKTWEKNRYPIYEELIFEIKIHLEGISEFLHTNSEQAISEFLKNEIEPVLAHIAESDPDLGQLILAYKYKIEPDTGSYYDHRRNYAESVMQINKKLSGIIDDKQEEAQSMYPHYFERYKTDGVEHNLYVGDSIARGKAFDLIYRDNLRLWQLQVVCEMENAHYCLKHDLPLPLDVTSLILVYNTSLSIRFRMDEKRFDVDGTYNARYEVIKKRIDKSFIKGTSERLTQVGKIAIVYSQKKDEQEYLRYIKFLKSKGYFGDSIELVELEGLQGVSGLRAIRVEILYKKDREAASTYTYADLKEHMKEEI